MVESLCSVSTCLAPPRLKAVPPYPRNPPLSHPQKTPDSGPGPVKDLGSHLFKAPSLLSCQGQGVHVGYAHPCLLLPTPSDRPPRDPGLLLHPLLTGLSRLPPLVPRPAAVLSLTVPWPWVLCLAAREVGEFLPDSQVSPLKPAGHWQLKLLTPWVQVPPFWQGWEAHSFTSETWGRLGPQ